MDGSAIQWSRCLCRPSSQSTGSSPAVPSRDRGVFTGSPLSRLVTQTRDDSRPHLKWTKGWSRGRPWGHTSAAKVKQGSSEDGALELHDIKTGIFREFQRPQSPASHRFGHTKRFAPSFLARMELISTQTPPSSTTPEHRPLFQALRSGSFQSPCRRTLVFDPPSSFWPLTEGSRFLRVTGSMGSAFHSEDPESRWELGQRRILVCPDREGNWLGIDEGPSDIVLRPEGISRRNAVSSGKGPSKRLSYFLFFYLFRFPMFSHPDSSGRSSLPDPPKSPPEKRAPWAAWEYILPWDFPSGNGTPR